MLLDTMASPYWSIFDKAWRYPRARCCFWLHMQIRNQTFHLFRGSWFQEELKHVGWAVFGYETNTNIILLFVRKTKLVRNTKVWFVCVHIICKVWQYSKCSKQITSSSFEVILRMVGVLFSSTPSVLMVPSFPLTQKKIYTSMLSVFYGSTRH